MNLLLAGLALLLATLLPMASHSSLYPPASPQHPATAVGKIEPAGEISVCMQGATHNLLDEAGEWSYQLAGHLMDLQQYEGERVRVIGTVEEGLEGCPPLLTVVQVVP